MFTDSDRRIFCPVSPIGEVKRQPRLSSNRRTRCAPRRSSNLRGNLHECSCQFDRRPRTERRRRAGDAPARDREDSARYQGPDLGRSGQSGCGCSVRGDGGRRRLVRDDRQSDRIPLSAQACAGAAQHRYFTCRRSDFNNPDVADEILRLYGEERGQGIRLYRFPVLFAFNDWMQKSRMRWRRGDRAVGVLLAVRTRWSTLLQDVCEG
nr:hypothetical protein [Burkholderia gladioli]